ncbi:MAG: hypothetical protein COW29_10380 [Rhodobacterales bacterium CG15_BIG_FIL_POST_REV_8_21_14_020_59_13]|nr:MAG: hypothetical protein COW29_10380 [Rhodobacterales bacterium CG15_BIG_FIL_POST_REV_8_21_14_020_59_13]
MLWDQIPDCRYRGARMTEFPRNELEAALQQAAEDPVARPDFFNLLLDATIYVIGKTDAGLPAGEFRISGGDTLSLASFEFDDGQPFIPFSHLWTH